MKSPIQPLVFTKKLDIKNKIKTGNITIKQGGLDIYDLKEFVQSNQLANTKKMYAFNNVTFEEINTRSLPLLNPA